MSDPTPEIAALVAECKRLARHLFDSSPEAEDLAPLSMAIDRLAALAAPVEKAEPVAWIHEWGAVDFPHGHPSRVTCIEAFHTEDEARQAAVGHDFNERVFPVYASPTTAEVAETVPWPVVSRYSSSARRVWLRLGDGPEEVEYVPTTAEAAGVTDEQIDNCLPLGMAPHSTLIGPREIRQFARAVITSLSQPPAQADAAHQGET